MTFFCFSQGLREFYVREIFSIGETCLEIPFQCLGQNKFKEVGANVFLFKFFHIHYIVFQNFVRQSSIMSIHQA